MLLRLKQTLHSVTFGACIAVLWHIPAYAQAGTPIPEPSLIAIIGLGVAGLLVGRRIAKQRPDRRDD